MNHYEPGRPRALIGLAAVVMTAATLAVAVLVPVAANGPAADADVLARTTDTSCATDGSVTSIDVVAVRNAYRGRAVESRATARHGFQV